MCDCCDCKYVITRPTRTSLNLQVMKDCMVWDRIARERSVICFETKAAELMDREKFMQTHLLGATKKHAYFEAYHAARHPKTCNGPNLGSVVGT